MTKTVTSKCPHEWLIDQFQTSPLTFVDDRKWYTYTKQGIQHAAPADANCATVAMVPTRQSAVTYVRQQHVHNSFSDTSFTSEGCQAGAAASTAGQADLH